MCYFIKEVKICVNEETVRGRLFLHKDGSWDVKFDYPTADGKAMFVAFPSKPNQIESDLDGVTFQGTPMCVEHGGVW
jgi:hypothetical protein